MTPLINAAGQIGEGSVDIRLGPDIIVSPRATGATVFDPADPQEFRRDLDERQEYVRRGIGDPFLLQPGEFVIGRSLEYVTLPADISAEALGRSSWGRLGLVIATATLIQPGFKGTITLELANVGDTAIRLTVGLSIAQLVFQRCAAIQPKDAEPPTSVPAESRPERKLTPQQRTRVREWRAAHRQTSQQRGRYRFQIKPALSRLHEDKDLRWVTPIAVRYVLGIVGERFAGKSTTIDYLTTRRHFRLYRLTAFIQEEASRRGLDAQDRRILRRVGNEMREEHGDAVLAHLAFETIRSDHLDSDSRRRAQPIVIEGFRVPAELEAWQEIEAFRPLIVTAETTVRRERAVDGGWLNEEELEGYPEAGSEREKNEWFEARIDRRDGSKPRSKVVEVAAQREDALKIVNEFSSVRKLQSAVSDEIAELEKWWRTREY